MDRWRSRGGEPSIDFDLRQPIEDCIARPLSDEPDERLVLRCKQYVELLLRVPPGEVADERVELSWRIVQALLHDPKQIDLAHRALLAASPAGTKFRDRVWERRWLTALGVVERIRGNIAGSLSAEAAGLSVALEIGDSRGEAVSLINLGVHALYAARLEEALRLFDSALKAGCLTGHYDIAPGAFLNRGVALIYLGRYAEALDSAQRGLLVSGPILVGADRRTAVLARCLAIEALVSLGRWHEARPVLSAAEALCDVRPDWAIRLEVGKAEALIEIASGCPEKGFAALNDLRKEVQDRPSMLIDLLHLLYRANAIVGRSHEAVRTLAELRDVMAVHAEQMLKGICQVPLLAEYLPARGVTDEVHAYVQAKELLVTVDWQFTAGWEFLVALSATGSAAEDDSFEHCLRVARLASRVARALGISEEMAKAIEVAGLVHDAGKISVPHEVLLRTEALSGEESSIYFSHTEIGAQLIEQVDIPYKQLVANVARYHHSAFDGLGGRGGPRGEDIPIEARIVAACDAFDALISGRPNLCKREVAAALSEIFSKSGRDYDPAVVDALISVVRGLRADASGIREALADWAEEIPFYASRRALNKASSGRG